MITTASKGSENINYQIEWTSSDKEAKLTALVNNEKLKIKFLKRTSYVCFILLKAELLFCVLFTTHCYNFKQSFQILKTYIKWQEYLSWEIVYNVSFIVTLKNNFFNNYITYRLNNRRHLLLIIYISFCLYTFS